MNGRLVPFDKLRANGVQGLKAISVACIGTDFASSTIQQAHGSQPSYVNQNRFGLDSL